MTSSKTIWIYVQTIKIINILVTFTITFSRTPTLDKLNGWGSHLDGWVILVNEVVLDKLDGQSALAHTSCPDHHKFVLRHAWGESVGRGYTSFVTHQGRNEQIEPSVWIHAYPPHTDMAKSLTQICGYCPLKSDDLMYRLPNDHPI